MALADWDVFEGNVAGLSTRVAYSGARCLKQHSDYPRAKLVHNQTYTDAPLFARVDTFCCVPLTDAVGIFDFEVGAIFRKQQATKDYIEFRLWLETDDTGHLYFAHVSAWEVYNDGADTFTIFDQGITEDFSTVIPEFQNLAWALYRFELLEKNGVPTFSLYVSPQNADDPEGSLIEVFSYQYTPQYVTNGGAVGLVVLVTSDGAGNPMESYYDLTKIWY